MKPTKAQRSAAAKKAARTRKRNARLKNQGKTKSNTKKRKIKLGKISPKVSSFIENSLKGLIINDMKNHAISNEADLQFSVVNHLNQFLDKYENVKVSSQLPIRIKKNDSDIFVDVVVSTVVHSFAEISPFVAIELKEHLNFRESDLRDDLKKLEKLRKHNIIKNGYQIFICRSKYPEKILQEEADACVKRFHSSITPIIINIYQHIKASEKDTFDRRWNQSKRYYHYLSTEHIAAKHRKRRKKKK